MSKGEFNSVAQVNGGLDNMINWDGKDKDLLALIKYIADEDKLDKVLENPQVIKTRWLEQQAVNNQVRRMYGRHGNNTKGNERQEIIYVLCTGWHRAVRLL